MSNEDIFDILDISTREDSYTKLIKSFFECLSQTDQSNFYKKLYEIKQDNLGEISEDDLTGITWKAYFRKTYSFSQDGKNINKNPDLVIEGKINKSLKYFVIIENKVLATEGHLQTKNYYKIFQKIKEDNEGVKSVLLFLTLNGDAAESEYFTSLSYQAMCEIMHEFIGTSEINTNQELKTCANAFINRVNAFNSKKSNIETKLKDIFTYHWGRALLPQIGKVLNDRKQEFLKDDKFKDLKISASDGLINKYSVDFSKEEWTGEGKEITRIPINSEMMQYVDSWRMGFYLKVERRGCEIFKTYGIFFFFNTNHGLNMGEFCKETKFMEEWGKNLSIVQEVRDNYFSNDKTISQSYFRKPVTKNDRNEWIVLLGNTKNKPKSFKKPLNNESFEDVIIKDKDFHKVLSEAVDIIDRIMSALKDKKGK